MTLHPSNFEQAAPVCAVDQARADPGPPLPGFLREKAGTRVDTAGLRHFAPDNNGIVAAGPLSTGVLRYVIDSKLASQGPFLGSQCQPSCIYLALFAKVM
jgi:hypothetical protein